jgi:Holliday junction DNA helicase RuvA
MISYLKGRLTERLDQGVVIEVAGVGFGLIMSVRSSALLGELGSAVTVHTLLQLRDDGAALYGFASLDEKTLFEKLITVSGVGPKVALSALSAFQPSELTQVISDEDITRISSIPGIGKKTAQRIVLELKGVLALDEQLGEGSASCDTHDGRKDTQDALLSMGFTLGEVQAALKGYEGTGDTAALLQYALKRLGG